MTLATYVETKKIESTPWRFDGQLDEATFQRLGPVSESDTCQVHLQLAIQREARHEIRVLGELEAQITLVCQRCLSNYICDLAVTFDEVFTEKNPYADLAAKADHNVDNHSEQEGYFNTEGFFCLLHYVEDEILLAVPTFPAHPDEQHCNKAMLTHLQEDVETKQVRENPFAVLKNLK